MFSGCWNWRNCNEVPDDWIVKDADGRTVYIDFVCSTTSRDDVYFGYLVIEIDKNSFSVADNYQSDMEAISDDTFPAIPDAKWEIKKKDEITLQVFTTEIGRSTILDYCDQLLGDGYTLTEEAEPYLQNVGRTFTNSHGDTIRISCQSNTYTGSCMIIIKLAE